MRKFKSQFLLVLAIGLILTACGSSSGFISTPLENIDNTPLKHSELTSSEEKNWSHFDLVNDTIPGVSLKKAYEEIIKSKKGKQVIVAIIDSGVDIDHEDLDDVIWTNPKEIPNNGKDDDKNGYVDDLNGWNFLGDAYNEQFEFVRLLASENNADPRYNEAKAEYDEEFQKYSGLKSQYDQIVPVVENADKIVSEYLKKTNYTKAEVNAIKTEDQNLLQQIYMVKQTYNLGFDSMVEAKESLNKDLKAINERLDFNLNKDLNGRKAVGDNPDDINDTNYGNANVRPVADDEIHGTHVAGIVAAERDNNIGALGAANNVKLMILRAVPNGDEYDKDIALAIRYAADNGAKVVNMSFGKYYSPHSQWVQEAIIYAAEKDVLLVHAAGNESLNIDEKGNFPSDKKGNVEIADNFISVGATAQTYGTNVVADYSNYGKNTVDVFAPGSNIYSTFPNNEYEAIDGTSMAAPLVTGVAAIIRSQYPKLSAAQVKRVIKNSGLPLKTKVVVGGDSNNVKPFSDLSTSSKLVNAFNALIIASQTK